MAIGMGVHWTQMHWALDCGGYLAVRTQVRSAIELERQRNRDTLNDINAMRDGGTLVEQEPNGRLRMVWTPAPARTVVSFGPTAQP